jgi:taurine dioxygenase
MTLNARPITDAVGVEVVDVDVRTLRPADFDELRELWRRHLVLVFRDQNLTPADQAAFCEGLGQLYVLPTNADSRDGVSGNMFFISNQVVDGKPGALPDGEMWFHYDLIYSALPPAAGVLFGIEIPPGGGNTRFANSMAVYEGLSGEVKDRLDGLTAEHVYDYRSTTSRTSVADAAADSHRHPAVVRHPALGKPVLYVSRLMTIRLLELDQKESDELLQHLFDEIERPEYHYEHIWRPGDLVVWDNNGCLHARTDFDPKYHRTLRRMSLANTASPAAYRRHAATTRS